MYEIVEIKDKTEKKQICDSILKHLSSWFVIEQFVNEYIDEIQEHIFYCALDYNKEVLGFISLKIHNEYTAEIFLMGVKESFHRRGVGRKLVEKCENYCFENDREFLTIKTIDFLRYDESYAKTRTFFSSLGFRQLDICRTLYDDYNPYLLMIKHLYSMQKQRIS